MIIASDNSHEGTGLTPVQYHTITYVERLIHKSTLDEGTKTAMELRLYNVQFEEEVEDMIYILKQNQKKDLNEEFDEALRRNL